jgi:hypothetical protein
MPARCQTCPPALVATAPVAVHVVTAYRDHVLDDHALDVALLGVVGDTEKVFGLVAHLARIAVQASDPEALQDVLGITERLGR